MSLFGVRLDNNIGVSLYMAKLNKKLKEPNFIKNPFRGGAYNIGSTGNQTDWAIIMVTAYPKVYYIGYFAIVVMLFTIGFSFTPFYLLPLALAGTHYFWSRHFYLKILKNNLSKLGYAGPFIKLDGESVELGILKLVG